MIRIEPILATHFKCSDTDTRAVRFLQVIPSFSNLPGPSKSTGNSYKSLKFKLRLFDSSNTAYFKCKVLRTCLGVDWEVFGTSVSYAGGHSAGFTRSQFIERIILVKPTHTHSTNDRHLLRYNKQLVPIRDVHNNEPLGWIVDLQI